MKNLWFFTREYNKSSTVPLSSYLCVPFTNPEMYRCHSDSILLANLVYIVQQTLQFFTRAPARLLQSMERAISSCYADRRVPSRSESFFGHSQEHPVYVLQRKGIG